MKNLKVAAALVSFAFMPQLQAANKLDCSDRTFSLPGVKYMHKIDLENLQRGGVGMWEELVLWPKFWQYTGVNHFSDADMLCIGIRGRGKESSRLLHMPQWLCVLAQNLV